MGRGKSVVGGNSVPFPDSATDKDVAATPIPTGSDVRLSTLLIPGGDVAKIILMTVELADDTGGENITLKLFRGAAEIDVTDRYTALTPLGRLVMSAHWRDDTPGAGQVAYSVWATGDVGGQTQAESRRLTALHG